MKWNKSVRAELRGFRRRDPSDPPDVWAPVDAADAWATLRANPAWTLDARVHREALESIVAQCALPAPPPFDERIELLRAGWLLGGRVDSVDQRDWQAQAPERALARFWLATGGVAATLRLLLANADFATTRSTARNASGAVLTRSMIFHAPDPVHPSVGDGAWSPDRYGFRPSFDPVYQWGGPSTVALWTGVRCAMATLTDDAFRAATEEARAVRATLRPDDHWAHAAIAFAFARDPSHARELLARLADGPRCSNGRPSHYPGGVVMNLLTLAAPDIATAAVLLPHCDAVELAFDLVEAFGDDAGPALEAALVHNHVTVSSPAPRKANEKRLAAALKMLGRAVSAETLAAAEEAARPVLRATRPAVNPLGGDRYAVTLTAEAMPSLAECAAILEGTRRDDGLPWEDLALFAEAAAKPGAREFWVVKPKGHLMVRGAVIVWAEAQGFRPATLREALAFHHAVPDALDARGYAVLGSWAMRFRDACEAPRFERHKKIGPRVETLRVASTEGERVGDACGVFGVDWRYRPVGATVDEALEEGLRFLLVRA